MKMRRRIILLGGAAVIGTIGWQPAAANAATLICDSWFPYEGANWTLQFECGGGWEGIGCYYDGVASYRTFECAFNTPGGPGCDSQQCNDSK